MRKLMVSAFAVLLISLTALLLFSCGNGNSARIRAFATPTSHTQANSPVTQQAVVDWPSSLPVDGLQP